MAVFSEAFLRLRQDFDQAHENRQKLLTQLRADVRDMAQETGSQLAEQGATRRAEFTAMITDLRGKLKEQAEQTRRQLSDLAADLRQAGAAFGRRQPVGRRGWRNR